MKTKKSQSRAIKNPWFWVSTIAVIVVILMAYYIMVPRNDTNNDNTGSTVTIGDEAVEGSANAKVTIIEFSDYECPYCGKFYSETLPQIREDYIDTGLAKLALKDFPLSFHANAEKAAEAAECAGEEGDDKYYEMHDLLFEKGVGGGVSSFKEYAQEIGLDTENFNSCLDSGKMADEIKEDISEGQAAGVQGTPTFFINGKMISGAQPYSVFKAAIEEALQ